MGASDPEDDFVEPPNIRFLRRLVTTLTAVMILGLIVVIGLLVIRISDDTRPELVFPETLPLEPGVQLVGWSQTDAHIIAVTDDGRVLVFDLGTRELQQELVFAE